MTFPEGESNKKHKPGTPVAPARTPGRVIPEKLNFFVYLYVNTMDVTIIAILITGVLNLIVALRNSRCTEIDSECCCCHLQLHRQLDPDAPPGTME